MNNVHLYSVRESWLQGFPLEVATWYVDLFNIHSCFFYPILLYLRCAYTDCSNKLICGGIVQARLGIKNTKISVWDNLLKSWECSMVNLFPREVPWVLNMFPRELIEGPPQDFCQSNPLLHLWPDPRPKTLGACGPMGFWPWVWPRPREQIENSRDFLREQIHHATPKAFQQIVILTKSLQCLPE